MYLAIDSRYIIEHFCILFTFQCYVLYVLTQHSMLKIVRRNCMFSLPGHGVCIHVLLSMASPLHTFPGLHERVLVCKLLPHVAEQGPKAVHCVKFSSPFPYTALRAASMDALYSSSSRICSISKNSIIICQPHCF